MVRLSDQTISLLEDIEIRIDPETEEDFEEQWRSFLYGKFEGEIFRPKRKKLSAPSFLSDSVNINDAVSDYDAMLRAQLINVSNALASEERTLAIRANYGTGILSSILGAQIFVMPREMNTLPTTRSVDGTDWIRAAVERGIPDLDNGFGKNVLEFGNICAEVFSKYPKISKYLNVYHPDLQGPLDICELIWGGEMFYALYDEPELVHGMLSLITDTYTLMMNKWFELFAPKKDINPHWETMWFRGKIVLRNDSAMNISPELYDEFSVPYDKLLLERFGGGMMHFCGRGDHYIESLTDIPGLSAINMSQPWLNDMEKIFKNTVDKGVAILAFNAGYAEKLKTREGGFRHLLSI